MYSNEKGEGEDNQYGLIIPVEFFFISKNTISFPKI